MSTIIKGTNTSSTIVPYTTDDTYPTHEAQYGKGGLRSSGDLNSIPLERCEVGMIVYNLSNGKYYKLTSLSPSLTWEPLEFGGGGGGSDKTFEYRDHETSGSNTWVINHNLGKHPSITITDSTGEMMFGKIEYNNLNTVTITFSEIVTGVAYLN